MSHAFRAWPYGFKLQPREEALANLQEAIALYIEPIADDAREARRQSLLVSRRRSEREALELIEQTGDTQGWK